MQYRTKYEEWTKTMINNLVNNIIGIISAAGILLSLLLLLVVRLKRPGLIMT